MDIPGWFKKWSKWYVPILFCMLFGMWGFGVLPAVADIGNDGVFEIDENVIDDTAPNTGDDWKTLFTFPGGNPSGMGSALVRTYVTDVKSFDDIFTTGGSKDESDISEWRWTDGNVPDKDDLLSGFAALYVGPDGHMRFYGGGDRFAVNGDAMIGLWLFRGSVNLGPNGTFVDDQGNLAHHQIGDVLILSNFVQGGGSANIEVYRVSAVNTDGSVTLQSILSGTAGANRVCNGPIDSYPAGIACAATNGTVTESLDPAYRAKGEKTSGWYPPVAFFEIGLDMDAIGLAEECFSSFLLETRSSQSITAQLKDFVLGRFETCGTITIRKVTDGGDDYFDYTTSFNLDTDGFTLQNGQSIVYTDVVAGNYSVTESGIPTGWDLTDILCTASGAGTSYSISSSTVNITMGIGGDVDCTYTNTKRGKIIVQKVTVPSGDPQSFSFTPSYGAAFNLSHGQSNDSGWLVPGTYSVSEDVPAGWDLTSAVCSDGSPVNAIALGAGETVTCTFTNTKRGRVHVYKTVTPSGGISGPGENFNFEIRTGASPSSSGTVVASCVTDATGFCDFSGTLFVPGNYQFCEVGMMPGWTNNLSGFTPDAENPEGADNSSECVNFTLDPGETEVFYVDNTPPPGGEARTIGFWKNWTSCDGKGNQDPVLDDTLATFPIASGKTKPGVYIGKLYVDECWEAVRILNKTTVNGTAAKKANDAAYGLAAQLLAALLNIQAGAGYCPAVTEAIAEAQTLLSSVWKGDDPTKPGFDGTGNYLGPKTIQKNKRAKALSLANTLDLYNNNELCP